MPSIRIYVWVPVALVERKDQRGSYAATLKAGGRAIDIYLADRNVTAPPNCNVLVYFDSHSFCDLEKVPPVSWFELIGGTLGYVNIRETLTGFGQVYEMVPGEYRLNDSVARVQLEARVRGPDFDNKVDFSTVSHSAVIEVRAWTLIAARQLYDDVLDGTQKATRVHGLSLRQVDDRMLELKRGGVTSVLNPYVHRVDDSMGR